jgi:hypothetical protein
LADFAVAGAEDDVPGVGVDASDPGDLAFGSGFLAGLADRWIELQPKAARTPIPTKTPTVAEYLEYWLAEVIKPNREEGTYSAYELSSRLHIIPATGSVGLTS